MPSSRFGQRTRARLRPVYRALSAVLQRQFTADELGFGRMMSMSQFGEDVVLAQLFRGQSEGFYVDVGALHPSSGSNTYALHRRGWRGINIEPQADQHKLFQMFRPVDVNLSCAVGARTGTVELRVDGSFSSLSDVQSHARSDCPTMQVPIRPLAEILTQHLPVGTVIDLLDVDCEGADAEVLASNDWQRFRPRVVLAERGAHAELENDPRVVLEDEGYALFCTLGLTSIFLSGEEMAKRPRGNEVRYEAASGAEIVSRPWPERAGQADPVADVSWRSP